MFVLPQLERRVAQPASTSCLQQQRSPEHGSMHLACNQTDISGAIMADVIVHGYGIKLLAQSSSHWLTC